MASSTRPTSARLSSARPTSARWQAWRGGKLGEAKLGETASSARPTSARWQGRRGPSSARWQVRPGQTRRGGKLGEAKLGEVARSARWQARRGQARSRLVDDTRHQACVITGNPSVARTVRLVLPCTSSIATPNTSASARATSASRRAQIAWSCPRSRWPRASPRAAPLDVNNRRRTVCVGQVGRAAPEGRSASYETRRGSPRAIPSTRCRISITAHAAYPRAWHARAASVHRVFDASAAAPVGRLCCPVNHATRRMSSDAGPVLRTIHRSVMTASSIT